MMNVRIGRATDAADCFLLLGATFIIGLIAFHRYYFGDAILPFYFSYEHGANFWSIYSSLNEYKPRLVYNGIWAIGAYYGLPRAFFMSITVVSIGSLAILAYHVARMRFDTSRLVALLAGSIIITSRFSMVSYYDYIAGTIESLSALCFILAVILIMTPQVFAWLSPAWRILLAILGCVFAVFIHERYMAGAAALGGVVMARAVNWKQKDIGSRVFFNGLMIAVIPIALFVLATKMENSLPLMTGTAGRQVAFSLGVIERAAVYLGNVLLGLNVGHQWLVGSLQFSGALHSAIIVTLICFFSSIYIFITTLGRKEVEWRSVIEICFIIGALILVASLPDASRQEGRWMTPALALLTLLAMYLGRASVPYLLVLFITNLTYLVAGSHFQIYNVEASKMASAIAAPLNKLRPDGENGVVLNAPDNGAQWVLGGYGGFGNDGKSGRVFSRLNFPSQIRVDPGVAVGRHDFGLYYVGADGDNDPFFTYINHEQLELLQHPEVIAPGEGRIIAGAGAWRAWHWNGSVAELNDSVELRPGVVGTWVAPAVDLDHKLIVYRAKTITGDAVPMRIQINWGDEKGRFLGAFIKVVNVGKAPENFIAVVAAPAGAREGTVYANLHDGAMGEVELNSIKLIGD